MGILTVKEHKEIKFDKQKVIEDIKVGLIDFPEWCFFTTPDYRFDFILMRSKPVKEGLEIVGSVWSEVKKKTDAKTYQIVCAVCVGEKGSYIEDDMPLNFNGAAVLFISSPKQLFRKLSEHD